MLRGDFVVEDGRDGGVHASESLGERGCQRLTVADGRGSDLVARGGLGGGVCAPGGLADWAYLLRVLQDALLCSGLLGVVCLAIGVVLDWPC